MEVALCLNIECSSHEKPVLAFLTWFYHITFENVVNLFYPDVVIIIASFTEPVLEISIRKMSYPRFLNFAFKISFLNSSR